MDAVVAASNRRALLLLLLFSSSVHAAVFNYNGVGTWSEPAGWSRSTVPTLSDEVWMNTADASINIASGYTAEIDKLIVGRHALNTNLDVNGGTLLVGSGDNDILFVGQYDDAEGTVNLASGRVEVKGELAVGVAGKGTWVQNGGTTYVRDRFVIGRYDRAEAIGTVILRGGSVVASRFDMNSRSILKLEGGIVALNGNHLSKVEGHINDGRIVGTADVPTAKVTYDAAVDRTYIYAKTTTLHTNYYGKVQTSGSRMLRGRSARKMSSLSYSDISIFPSWFEPSAWQPNGVPGLGSEVWMYTSGTSALVGLNEVATAEKLIVGRRNDAMLAIDGGELLVGDKDSTSAILFIGQYVPSKAIVVQKAGRIKVNGEFAVAVGGAGEFHHFGGTVEVTGRLIVGRYNKPEAIGHLLLDGGEISADRLEINDYSTVDLQAGRIYLQGNKATKMLDYVQAEKILSHGSSSVLVQYDAATDRTILEGQGSPGDWDIANILRFDTTKVGPKALQIDRQALEIREFKPAPAYGIHPRIFFGPDEIARVRSSLQNTSVGQAAYSQAKQLIALLAYGRTPCGGNCYDDIPKDDKNLPNGKQKLSNVGLYHANPTYEDLVSGSCTMVEGQTGTHRNVLGGSIAIEAFDLLIFPEQSDASARKNRLASAMSNWADCALNNPQFVADGRHGTAAARDLFGGQHLAFAYDLAFNFLSDEQRAKVRKAIATMIWTPEQFTGITTEGYATTTNWVTINSFTPMMILAIEGETTKEVDGWSTAELEKYFDDIMMAHYKFFTYGYYAEGAGYEGAGKNYQYNAMMAAYAKRGYNFFKHPHVQAYATKFLPSTIQPFGHFVTSYDTIGGTGLDAELGGQRFHPNDIIGLKWAYPNDPSVDFIYRQYLETPYRAADGSKQSFLDVYEQKITSRSTYANAFLSLLIMPSDYNTAADFDTMSAAARKELTFNGKERGLIITRSDFSETSLAMNFHVRQDTGGHTYGDRNSFTLSGLGRVWVRNPVGKIPETEWSSGILVDGQGITIAPEDGRKARMPARIAAFQDNALATFTMGDATYAYNTAWKWCATCRPVGSNVGISGWDPVMETWNTFRHPSNQISEFYGSVPFVDYANWRYGGYTEGMHKRKVNDLDQVYRQAGLIRGEYPYTLIVDDLHKISNSANTEWQWIAQLPEDLTVVPTSDYTSNLDPATDIVFKEPSSTGNRKLLVRILNAEGSQPQGLFEYKEFQGDLSGGLTAWRLTIRRVAERPRFRIILYPFEDGQPIPEHLVAPDGSVSLKWTQDKIDNITFHSYTQSVGGIDVEMTGIEITRSGNQDIIDTRDQAVPVDVRW